MIFNHGDYYRACAPMMMWHIPIWEGHIPIWEGRVISKTERIAPYKTVSIGHISHLLHKGRGVAS